jgi:hypothetical protein
MFNATRVDSYKFLPHLRDSEYHLTTLEAINRRLALLVFGEFPLTCHGKTICLDHQLHLIFPVRHRTII